MLIKIKKPVTAKKLAAAEKKLAAAKAGRKKKGFDAKRFAGTVKWPEDGVTLQRKWRDEE